MEGTQRGWLARGRFLIVDDNAVFAGTLARGLERRGYLVSIAHDRSSALEKAANGRYEFITVDLHLGEDSGLSVIAPLCDLQPDARILVLTGYASIATAVQAVKEGADNYLAKPANIESILAALQNNASEVRAEAALENPVVLSIDRLEWEHIQRVLGEHDNNVSATARALNMHRRTLQRKLSKKPVRK